MENQTETIFVSDGADCSVLIKNRTSGGKCNIFLYARVCVFLVLSLFSLSLSLSNNMLSLFKIKKIRERYLLCQLHSISW
jgi:hypothetical protein